MDNKIKQLDIEQEIKKDKSDKQKNHELGAAITAALEMDTNFKLKHINRHFTYEV